MSRAQDARQKWTGGWSEARKPGVKCSTCQGDKTHCGYCECCPPKDCVNCGGGHPTRLAHHSDGQFISWCDNAAARCAQVEAANRWIPVEEKLPTREGRYLIIYEQGCIRRPFIGDFYIGDGWGSVLTDTKITHWKEIEELPATPSREADTHGL